MKCDHVTQKIIEVNVTGLGIRGTVSSEMCLLEDLGVLCLSHCGNQLPHNPGFVPTNWTKVINKYYAR